MLKLSENLEEAANQLDETFQTAQGEVVDAIVARTSDLATMKALGITLAMQFQLHLFAKVIELAYIMGYEDALEAHDKSGLEDLLKDVQV